MKPIPVVLFTVLLQSPAKKKSYRTTVVTKLREHRDKVFDMVNAAYHDKPLIVIGATFREKLVSHHRAVNE